MILQVDIKALRDEIVGALRAQLETRQVKTADGRSSLLQLIVPGTSTGFDVAADDAQVESLLRAMANNVCQRLCAHELGEGELPEPEE